MLNEGTPGPNLRQSLDAIAVHDQQKDLLIQEALQSLEAYKQQVMSLTTELDDTKKSRLWLQEKVEQLVQETVDFENISRNKFVVVLVDGDGAIFSRELLENPKVGANEAARRLIQNVKASLRDDGLDTDVAILVRIFANLNDLGKMLSLTNTIHTRGDLNTFAELFTVSRGEFDFINVGYGKENADSKIRYMLDHYYNNFQCQQIFFIGCHDTGYINELQRYTNEPNRIVLVETTPAPAAFSTMLPFAIKRFDNVFRSTSLTSTEVASNGNGGRNNSPERLIPTQIALINTSPYSTSVRPVPVQTPNPYLMVPEHRNDRTPSPTYKSIANTHLSIAQPQPQPQPHPQQMAKIIHSGNGGVSVQYSSPANGTITYATACGTGEYGNIYIKPGAPLRTIEYNHAGQRIDKANKKPADQPAFVTYFKKLQGIKGFCNYQYLLGTCRRGDQCTNEHDLPLTERELAVHRYRARLGLCANGSTCSDFNCFFSHHCPYVPNCTSPDCRFSLHISGKDLEVRERWTEGKGFPDILREA
ncbi:uncharacterized protein N7483_003808 [Penicillium malachiteum]|uniref:uncharacterized protein n=1 Tax=Penicillium malachiteum TaxID=1324776 RepID=UPI0025484444|nr:uncharacterized protein N7483_003808 [Penicillium malachiteum]KAJ5729300.1 hypothetical protein N7483_003808 [Penicillium malachiteum]